MKSPGRVFRFGPFTFDSAQQELRRRTQRLRLSVSLIKLLTLFLNRRGELITREEIALALWKDSGTIDVVTGINTAVRRLRAQLDDDPGAPTYIETVIGIGYRFIADVEETEDTGIANISPGSLVESPLVQEPTLYKGPGHGAFALVPVVPLSEAENDLKLEPERRQTGRKRRLMPAVLFLGVAFLLATFGTLVGSRFIPSAASRKGSEPHPSLAQITFNHEENSITVEAVAPKGDLVAYGDRYGVSIHELDSGADRLLTSPTGFLAERISWHPDEDWLLASGKDLTNHRNQAWALFLHGEAPRLLLDDAGLAVVSPDGSQIAFTRSGNSEIWLADGIGQNAHLLVSKIEGESFTSLLWSPRSNRLIDDRVIAPNSLEPANADLANSPLRSRYESVDIHTGKPLSRQDNIRFDSGFLLKDGRFFFPTIGDFTGTKVMVASTDPSTGEFLSVPQPVSPSLVPDLGGDSKMLSASADGGWIGVVSTSRTSDVYVAEVHWPGPSLGQVARLTDGLANYYPDTWTPNGDAILFDRIDSASVIGKRRLGEAKVEVVAQLPDVAAMARFSPDGKWILFTEFAGSPGRAIGIFSVPSGGGKPRQLYTSGTVDEFHCPVSYTGSCVLRETIDKKEFVFFALDPVGGMQQKVGRAPWSPTMLGDWSVSPDGSTVAMANHDPGNPAIQLIHLSPNRSTPPSTIPVHGFGEVREATWSADAQGLFVETKTTAGYDLVYVNLAARTKLLRQSPIAIWGIPSRDGKKLAFPGLTVASNVWAGRTALP